MDYVMEKSENDPEEDSSPIEEEDICAMDCYFGNECYPGSQCFNDIMAEIGL